MHYVAIVDGAEHEVEVNETSANRFTLVIDGRNFDMDAVAVRDDTLSLICENQADNIESERVPEDGENLLVRGHVIHVDVLDLRRMRLLHAHKQGAVHEGTATVTSPMPGKVVAVLVTEGQTVAQGEGLLVIEAMKMENEMKAPRAGVVRNLTAKAGAAVEGGAKLCVIE